MAEDQDYNELLDQNVGEVKSSVRDLENPDYSELLELEKEGKDRKTVKEFLESQMEEDGSDTEESSDEETQTYSSEEEIIEEETSGGLLGSFSRNTVLVSGVVLGVLIGLIGAYGALGGASPTGMASQGEVENSITELFTATGMNASQFDVSEYTQQNGMHYVTINVTQQAGNETQTSSRSYYVSPDGQLLIPEAVRSPLGGSQRVVTNIENAIQQLEARQSQEAANQTSGNTTE